MDLLPEGQAGLLHARAQLRLQRGARRLHPEGGGLEGHGHLRGLHLPVVSGFVVLCMREREDKVVINIIYVLKLTRPCSLCPSGATWVCQQCVLTT